MSKTTYHVNTQDIESIEALRLEHGLLSPGTRYTAAFAIALVQLLAPQLGAALLVAWCVLFIMMGRRVDRRWQAFAAGQEKESQ